MAANGGGPACILATNPTADAGVGTPGNGNIQAPTCAVVADSTSTSAIAVGSGTINASLICAPGGYTKNTSGSATPTPTRCPPITDPLANLPAPSNVNDPCQHTNFRVTASNVPPITPGVYCGGITIGSNVTLTLQSGGYNLRNCGLTAP